MGGPHSREHTHHAARLVYGQSIMLPLSASWPSAQIHPQQQESHARSVTINSVNMANTCAQMVLLSSRQMRRALVQLTNILKGSNSLGHFSYQDAEWLSLISCFHEGSWIVIVKMKATAILYSSLCL